MTRSRIDKTKFVARIVAGDTYGSAYIESGGGAAGSDSNGSKLAKTPTIKRAINEALQTTILNSLTRLPLLTEKAMDKLFDLVGSDDEKIALQASKIAMEKARSFLPKEVNVNHTHEVTQDEKQNEAINKLEQIAAKLVAQGSNGSGAGSRIIEAIEAGRSGGVPSTDGGAGSDSATTEYTVHSEQEAETST